MAPLKSPALHVHSLLWRPGPLHCQHTALHPAAKPSVSTALQTSTLSISPTATVSVIVTTVFHRNFARG